MVDDAAIPDHPNVPSRTAVILAYGSVLIAGCFGVMIGWGLADITCTDQCTLEKAVAAIVGGAAAAAGAGVVAVLVLRAMNEWRAHPPDAGTWRDEQRPDDADVPPTRDDHPA